MKIALVDQIAKVNYKYTFSLAKALTNEGMDITLFIDKKEEIENCNCKRRNLFITDEKNIGKIPKLINYIRSYNSLRKIIKAEKFDILHFQWLIFSPVDYFFLKIIKKNGIRLVLTIHDILPFNQKFYDMYYHKRIYALSDEIIVQADNNVQRFNNLFPELAGKETVIPHGHFMDYAEQIDMFEAREKLFIDKEKFVYLFFGQIKKVKGVGILLEAFKKVHEKYNDAILIIAGSVWKDDFSSYKQIIDHGNFGESLITHIRYIADEDVKYYYSASNVCVLPYLDVYQSGVIQLTYAYRKPAIATEIGAFKEVVSDETGFFCKPGDSDSLYEAMIRAYEQKKILSEMGKKGYDFIEEKYSWKHIAESVCNLYSNK